MFRKRMGNRARDSRFINDIHNHNEPFFCTVTYPLFSKGRPADDVSNINQPLLFRQ